MGIRLVNEALSPAWGTLSETARLVLIAMCRTALDKTGGGGIERRYFGGHEDLILTLTGRDSHDPEWARTREHLAAQRRIKRAVRELVDAGAIICIQAANGRRKAIYEVLPRNADILPFLLPTEPAPEPAPVRSSV